MVPFDFHPRTRVIFGRDSSDRTGHVARELGFVRPLLVADPGIVSAGHAATKDRLSMADLRSRGNRCRYRFRIASVVCPMNSSIIR